MIEFKTREGGTALVVGCTPVGLGAGQQRDSRLIGVNTSVGRHTSHMAFCWRLDGSASDTESGYDLLDVPADIEARLSRTPEVGGRQAPPPPLTHADIPMLKGDGRREVLAELLGVLMPEMNTIAATADGGDKVALCHVEVAVLRLALAEGVVWPN